MTLTCQNFGFYFLFALLLFSGCRQPAVPAKSGTVAGGKPEWLQRQINTFESEKPANPPVKIYRYAYKGQLVYFISGRCCDIPSRVLDVEGQQLCQPDGGITGRGDGKCADFFDIRTDEKLIWEDLRK